MKNKKLLYSLGRPLSPFYSLGMRFREWLYSKGVLRVTRVAVPVISIGNLTMGGSGKTPIVQYIARFLKDKGMQPAVISRGYGGKATGRVNMVSDGSRVFLEAGEAGDEPRLLADTLDGIPVLTGATRKYPATKAIELGADVLVLDDGFQHMALARELDLVLFNAEILAGNSRVFPGGDLREPVKALNRCDGFIISGVSKRTEERAGQFAELLRQRFPDHPVWLSHYKAVSLLKQGANDVLEPFPLAELKDVQLFGFTGIAHPSNFRETLTELGFTVNGFKSYADHYSYREQDIEEIVNSANERGAGACITTEKDLVKLRGMQKDIIPIYALRMEVHFDETFQEFLLNGIQA